MAWNLHLVGEALETELEDVLQKFIADLEGIGHKLTSATLTTDAGQKPLATTPVEEPSQTVGGEPVVSTDTPAAPAEPESDADSTVPSSGTQSSSPTTDSSTSDPSSETTIAVTGPQVETDTPPVLGGSV
jgi:hypothetical protein